MAFDPISVALEVGGKLIDRLFPDPLARAEAQRKLLELQQTGELAKLAAETSLAEGQLAINKAEAKSDNLFVAGWRPFIGWTCGAAFCYHFILQPLLAFILAAAGHSVVLPSFDMSTLSTVLMGMLGLGGLRTVEKIKDVIPTLGKKK